jgi:hypothetical protein
MILTSSLSNIPERKPNNAPCADLRDFFRSFWKRYSPRKAPTNGPIITPQGPANSPSIIPRIHPHFPRLVPQNFLAPRRGRR